MRTEDEQLAFYFKNFKVSGYVPCVMCMYDPESGLCNAPHRRTHYYDGRCGIFSAAAIKKYNDEVSA